MQSDQKTELSNQQLIELINQSYNGGQLLEKLKEAHFALTDRTLEGESVLHLLVQTKKCTQYRAPELIKCLTEAGADVNASNKNNQRVITTWIKHKYGYSKDKLACVNTLFADKALEVHFEMTQGSLLDLIAAHSDYYISEHYVALINSPNFDPTQPTASSASAVDFFIAQNEHFFHKIFNLLLGHSKFNPSQTNQDGKSVFTRLSENPNLSGYSENLIRLINHPQFKVDTAVDAAGNHPLQILITSTRLTKLDAIKALLEKGVDMTFKNDKGESVTDTVFKHPQSSLWVYDSYNIFNQLKPHLTQVEPEYLLALLYFRPTTPSIEKIIKEFTQESQNPDKITQHIKELCGAENRPEEAIARMKKRIFHQNFRLNNFDNAFVKMELQHHFDSNLDKNSPFTLNIFGHVFSLEGSINGIKLTGGSDRETAPVMVYLIDAYVQHCVKTGKFQDYHPQLQQVRKISIKAMRYNAMFNSSLYGDNTLSRDELERELFNDCANEGAEIYTGWRKHGIGLVVKGDELYRNNGGGCSTDSTIEIYTIGQRGLFIPSTISSVYLNSRSKENKPFIQQTLHHLLELELREKIAGKFQSVGNCSLESKRISLHAKLRLFLPPDVSHEIYVDAIDFFEKFYLERFCESHKNTSTLAHALMRLIKQRYLPEKRFAQICDLIQKHINTTQQQDIMMVELIIMRWQLSKDPAALAEFDREMQKLGISINEQFSDRTRLVAHLIAGKLDDCDIECYRKLSITEQVFAGYNILHLAILNDNIDQVTTLHQLNEYLITFCTWYDQDVLCLAHSVEMAKTLVKLGAAKTRTKYDNALDHAIKGGNTELLAFLLETGQKPSKLSLYYASSRDIGMVQLLLKYHPESINRHTHSRRTPLHVASAAGKLDIVQELVRHGADPTTPDINGVTSLQTAVENDREDVAKFFVGHTDRFFQTPYRGDNIATMIRSPRLQQKFVANQQAAETDAVYFQIFQEQLKPKVIIKEDIDYLLYAVRKSNIRAVRGCLEKFPQLSATLNSNHYSTTPLHAAILGLARQEGEEYKKRLEIVKLLLLTGRSDINGICHTSEPAIFMATSIDNVEVLDIFLASAQLDINKQDNLGYTVLHDAVERGCVNSVRRLLQDARINISITNEDNKTAEDLNTSTQAREIKKLFVEYKAQQRAANQQTSSCLNLNF